MLMYRLGPAGALQVLLAHPGGPFWKSRDEGTWTIPKGEYQEPEPPLEAARREFHEETGVLATEPFLPIGEVVQKGGKHITAWAFAGDFDPAQLRCNTFEIEWPPKSGRMQTYPELDRVEWFGLEQAHRKINPAQRPFLDQLAARL